MLDLSYYKGKNVLVTGNTGFKGSWMAFLLNMLGARPVGIGLNPETTPALHDILNQEKNIKTYKTDIRDLEAVEDVFKKEEPDIVIHMAAQPIVIESYKNPVYTYDVNVMGTVNVCDCVRNSPFVESFVNVTTDKVYWNNEWEYAYREMDKLDGYDPYSNSKSCSELVTGAYKRSFLNEKGIPVSTCRAGNVIGGGDFSDNRIVPDCYRSVVQGLEISVRNPNAIRPYQHVLEAVVFYLWLALNQINKPEIAGEYNIGPNETDCLTTGELCDIFCRSWGEQAGWSSVEYTGPKEAGLLRLDASKAKMRLGWRPTWDAKKAIEESVKWYKAYSKNEDVKRITIKQIEEYLGDASSWLKGENGELCA